MAEQTEMLTNEQARAAVLEKLGLPPTSEGSDVIQHVISTSGHTCRLLDLMELAAIFGANIQLYVSDSDDLPIEKRHSV